MQRCGASKNNTFLLRPFLRNCFSLFVRQEGAYSTWKRSILRLYVACKDDFVACRGLSCHVKNVELADPFQGLIN